jgi:DNA-binding NarL/FixJ family response regulator
VQPGKAPPPPPFGRLAPGERETLGLIAAESKTRETSFRPFVSEKTTGNHVVNVFRELHVTERAQAIVRARDAGIGGEPKA